ncbi:MAG: type I glutamate--ammonia ligase [Peptococcaceae bacterium]|nr:type I glutamate--ammonia ligase [Peptococcaceae bacterium]
MATKQDVLARVKEDKVRFVRLQFTDILGVNKNVAISVDEIETALDGQLMFDGSSIEGFARIEESDMLLKADPATYAVFPWTKDKAPTARLICDVLNPDGTPFSGCPRGTLKRAVAEAQAMGYVMQVGPEAEFFLFKRDPDGGPTTITNDRGGYFDLSPIDRGEDARQDIVLTLEEMGFHVEASHHECAPGQHEIDFRYTDALTAADNVTTFKLVVRTVAMQHGLHATFMPKPLFGEAGSGMHINQSLFVNGCNAFYDQHAPHQLSRIAMSYLAGLMRHCLEFTAITNPLINSYKRLVPGYEAPVYIAWSERNRSPLIRVPARRGNGTRLELRSPDPSCNPYLAFAVALTAGLQGIKDGLTPPSPMGCNIYHLCEEDRLAAGITSLPGSLQEALHHFSQSELMRGALGEHIFTRFIAAKRAECRLHEMAVHPWELERYLSIH